MNSRERFLEALHNRPVDRTPVAHVAVVTTVEMQDLTGCHMPQVHRDPQQQAALLAANHDVLGFDGVSFIINYFNEPAALGVDMNWGDEVQLPTFKSPNWTRPEQISTPADFFDRPPISTNLATLRIARQRHAEHMAVLGKVMGPLSMVQVLMGIDRAMMAAIDEPDAVRGFLDRCTDLLIRSANAQFEAGADAIVIGEGGAGAKMMSPRMYADLLLPFHQRLIAGINGPTVMHICGDVRNRLDAMGHTGMTCFNFDWSIPPQEMVTAAAGKFTVMGNINTTDLLNAKPEDIRQQTRENLDAGVQIISPGCAISPKCPNANLRAMAEAVGCPPC